MEAPSRRRLISNGGVDGETSFIASLRGLPRWRDRLRLLREVAFPTTAYMRRAYGFEHLRFGAALLPALYLRRIVAGGWKVLTGVK